MVALLRVADFSDKRSEWRLSANLNSHSPLSATSRPLKAQEGLGVGLGWVCGAAGTQPLLTPQLQAEPCRCFR